MKSLVWAKWLAMSLVVMASAVVASAQVPGAVGIWEFENSGNLGLAKTGTDLSPTGGGFAAIAGPGGSDAGAVTVAVGSYYSMTHGIAANDGGARVNEYTLLIDFRVPSIGQWYSFFQTDVVPGLGDAEYFLNPGGQIGVSDITYSAGTFSDSTWYRLVFVWDGDTGASMGEYRAYVDGSEINTLTGPFSAPFLIDGQFSIGNALLLFSDNNAEDNPIDVSNVAIWDQALSAADATTLGIAGAAIPLPLTPITTSHFGIAEEGQVFTASTTSGGTGYQWFKDGSPMADGGSISGTTTDTLTINTLVIADSGTYHATFDDGNPRTSESLSLGVFAVGSLPVGGIVGLGIVGAALALGGAMRIRRRKK